MQRIEDQIRDKLVNCLHLFEEALELIDKEKYLPNIKGTRGFIDILAKDSMRRFVIIELKRSESSSREALHEVLKYVEGIKEVKSLKNDEIRVIIVSTEWEELLVPYSSFIQQLKYSVCGYHLTVDDSLRPIEVSEVKPLCLNSDRLISHIHNLRLYSSLENLTRGIESHKECFRLKGIKDYVLLILDAPQGLKEREMADAIRMVHDAAQYFGATESSLIDTIKRLEQISDNQYMIYSAVQVLSEEEYWHILQVDPGLLEEFKGYAEYWDHEQLMHYLHLYATENTIPHPYCERVEIGTPAKLTSLLGEVGWRFVSLIRSGRFQENELLTDEIIIGELKGYGGSSRQKYKKFFSSNNLASFGQMIKEIRKCLAANPIWQNGIIQALTEISEKAKSRQFDGKLVIYNPSNTIISIYKAVTSKNSNEAQQWIPFYFLDVEGDNIKMSYFGCLVRNHKRKSLHEIISSFYDGDEFKLLVPLNWGGFESWDYKISAEYGLEYANYLCVTEGDKQKYYKFTGFEYIDVEKCDPSAGFFSFLNDEPEFVNQLVQVFARHMITPGVFAS